MPPVPPTVSAVDFLRALWGDTEGWAELTIISKGTIKSFPFKNPESINSLVQAAEQHNKTSNVYMGVLLRKEKWPRPTGKMDSAGKPLIEYRGTEVNAQTSWAVWCEFDFEGEGHKTSRTVTEDAARKALKEFALKPSVIIRSGGGIHVYWFLLEPAENENLSRVKSVNKALAKYFGADPQSVDLARILRIPGSNNLKHETPRPCFVTWWKPDSRYTLDDFEDLLNVEDLHNKPATPAKAEARPPTDLELPEEIVAEIALALAEIWHKPYRHDTAVKLSGMLAWFGVSEKSAKAIITAASNTVGGNSDDRVKDVTSTYQKFYTGGEVTGYPAFLKMIQEEAYPHKEAGNKVLKTIGQCLGNLQQGKKKEQFFNLAPPELSELPISDVAKSIIKDGLPAYIDFRKTTDTPAKFLEREAAGKMSRSEADCYIVAILLQANVPEGTIHAIYRNYDWKIGTKAREKGDDVEAHKYVAFTIDICKKAMKSQPKWQATTIAGTAANKIAKDFEDEHFRIKLVERCVQEPPTYNIHVMLEGIEYVMAKLSLDQAYAFEAFTKAFFSKFNRHLPFQKEATYQRMYAAAEHRDIQIEKEEATFAGTMDRILNLLDETAVSEKSADISINHGSVRKDGNLHFKTPIVLRLLREGGTDAKKQDVIHYLNSIGWKSGSKRLGSRVDWVWYKTGSNGHGPSNGVQEDPGQPPVPPEPRNGHLKPPTKTVEPEHVGSDMLFEFLNDGEAPAKQKAVDSQTSSSGGDHHESASGDSFTWPEVSDGV